jgi:hypothetical protein
MDGLDIVQFLPFDGFDNLWCLYWSIRDCQTHPTTITGVHSLLLFRWHRWDSRETGPYLIGRTELQYRTPSTAITCVSIPVQYIEYLVFLLFCVPSPPWVSRHLAFVVCIMYRKTYLGCVWCSVQMCAGMTCNHTHASWTVHSPCYLWWFAQQYVPSKYEENPSIDKRTLNHARARTRRVREHGRYSAHATSDDL